MGASASVDTAEKSDYSLQEALSLAASENVDEAEVKVCLCALCCPK